MPDWLASAQPSGEDEEAEPAAEIESFDWSEEEPAAELISETPDWLSAIAPDAGEEGEDEIEPAVTEMPDWLASAQPSSEDEEAEPAAEIESFDWSEEEPAAELISETPDWLSAAAPLAEEEVESEIEAELEALEMEAEAEEAEPAAELAAMPDWLADAAPEAELDEDEEEQSMPPAASIAQTRILPEQDFGWAGDEEEAEPAYETEYEANPAHSQFGWLEESADEIEAIGESAASADVSMPDEASMDFEEKVLASASAPPPADNAPDWLNAMVPGLDLDYQAIEDDQPIESDYIDIPARREQPETAATAQPGDFNWLVDIVDEETGPMRAIQDSPESARSRRRFTFTRQPAWLRTLMAQRGRTESDDDFELPEWLR
jgi:hypothetical protein